MGTRHLICVTSGNRYRVAQYGQWDGYPSGQGLAILDFLKSPKVEQLKKNLDFCSWITADEYNDLWKGFGVEANQLYIDYDVYKEFCAQYPQLSRDTSAEILKIIADTDDTVKLQDDSAFANDSLFCEWAYVIDFDKNAFEVYRGFNETPLKKSDRFYTAEQSADENGLYPIRMIQSFKLSQLPSEDEFLEICEPKQDELDEEQMYSMDSLTGV